MSLLLNQIHIRAAIFGLMLAAFSAFNVYGQDAEKPVAPTKMSPQMLKAISGFEEEMLRKVRTQYDELATAEPLPNQLKEMQGLWHGSAIDDEFHSFWTYKRSSGGTFLARSIDQDLTEKTHTVKVVRGKWFLRGRLVYKFDDDPNAEIPLSVYVIDSIDSKNVQSRLVHEHEYADDWMKLKDERGIGSNPKPPAGFKTIP